MKTIVIIATFVACCFAAPALNLQHPSSINPSVLVEVTPQEKVVLITDPLEIAKFKREVPQPLYPTILPEDRPHHIAKRNELTKQQEQQKTAPTTERSEEKSDEDRKEDTTVKADEDSEEENEYDIVDLEDTTVKADKDSEEENEYDIVDLEDTTVKADKDSEEEKEYISLDSEEEIGNFDSLG